MMNADPDKVRLKPAKPLVPLEGPLDHPVVVLPTRLEGDVGIYSSGTANLVKELRAAGVDAAFLHDPAHKYWDVKLGDVPTELIIAFVGGLASGATLEAIKLVLSKGSSGQVHARVVHQRREADGAVNNSWFEYSGDKDGFLTALSDLDLGGEHRD